MATLRCTVLGVTDDEVSSGTGDRPDDVVPAATPQRPLTEVAPWLANPDVWSIGERLGVEIRPGMFVYTRETRSFVIVAAATHLPTDAGKVAFVDLADGRTLALDATAKVFARFSS